MMAGGAFPLPQVYTCIPALFPPALNVYMNISILVSLCSCTVEFLRFCVFPNFWNVLTYWKEEKKMLYTFADCMRGACAGVLVLVLVLVLIGLCA